MPRKYTMSDAALAVRRDNASKGGTARTSLDTYVSTIVSRAGELTPAHFDKLRALLRPAEQE